MTIANFREHLKENKEKESEFSSEINLIRNLIDAGHDELYQKLWESLDHYASIIKKKIMDSLGGEISLNIL